MNYIYEDDEIGLVLADWNDDYSDLYLIYLKDTKEEVGSIKLEGNIDKYTGNISYEIYEKYRGNKYALKAVNLIKNNLYEISDNDIVFSILPSNKASIKTAMLSGAKFYKTVELPKSYKISENGKYKYVNWYVIKNRYVDKDKNYVKGEIK